MNILDIVVGGHYVANVLGRVVVTLPVLALSLCIHVMGPLS